MLHENPSRPPSSTRSSHANSGSAIITIATTSLLSSLPRNHHHHLPTSPGLFIFSVFFFFLFFCFTKKPITTTHQQAPQPPSPTSSLTASITGILHDLRRAYANIHDAPQTHLLAVDHQRHRPPPHVTAISGHHRLSRHRHRDALVPTDLPSAPRGQPKPSTRAARVKRCRQRSTPCYRIL